MIMEIMERDAWPKSSRVQSSSKGALLFSHCTQSSSKEQPARPQSPAFFTWDIFAKRRYVLHVHKNDEMQGIKDFQI